MKTYKPCALHYEYLRNKKEIKLPTSLQIRNGPVVVITCEYDLDLWHWGYKHGLEDGASNPYC